MRYSIPSRSKTPIEKRSKSECSMRQPLHSLSANLIFAPVRVLRPENAADHPPGVGEYSASRFQASSAAHSPIDVYHVIVDHFDIARINAHCATSYPPAPPPSVRPQRRPDHSATRSQ